MAQLAVVNKTFSTEHDSSSRSELRLITQRSDEGNESFEDRLNGPGEFLCEEKKEPEELS